MSRTPDAWIVALAVLSSAWLGAALFAAGIVAPAAFAVLPSRALAGALVGRVLPWLFWTAAILGVASAAAGWRSTPARHWLAGAGATLALAGAAAQLVIGPRIARIREAMAGVSLDMMDSSDPRRLAFARLHGLSLLSLGIAMLAAALVTWMCWRELGTTAGP